MFNNFRNQDFPTGRQCELVSLLGNNYTGILEYYPLGYQGTDKINCTDDRAFLYLHLGDYVNIVNSQIRIGNPPNLNRSPEFEAWISAKAANSQSDDTSSLYVSHVKTQDSGLSEILMDTLLHIYKNKLPNSSVEEFAIGSPKHIVTDSWLKKWGIKWDNHKISVKGCRKTSPTDLSKLVYLVEK